MDMSWWDVHLREVRATFKGQLATFRINRHSVTAWPIKEYGNTGAGAISLSIYHGAFRVIMLAYDMQYTGGKRHFFGDHPRRLANAGNIQDWPQFFERLRKDNQQIEIINASRETALTLFPRLPLEQALKLETRREPSHTG